MAPCGLGTGTVPLLALLCRVPARCGVTAATTTSPPLCLPPGSPPGSPCLRLQLLGRCLATVQASCSWLMGKAFQFLASWSLHQFLLVTQGDLQVRQGRGGGTGGSAPLRGWGQDLGHSSSLCRLQLLKAETDALVLLVGAAFPEPGDSLQHLAPHQRLRCHQELWLCQQIRSMAASIQVGLSTASGSCATATAPGASSRHAPSRAVCQRGPAAGRGVVLHGKVLGCPAPAPLALLPSNSRGTC